MCLRWTHLSTKNAYSQNLMNDFYEYGRRFMIDEFTLWPLCFLFAFISCLYEPFYQPWSGMVMQKRGFIIFAREKKTFVTIRFSAWLIMVFGPYQTCFIQFNQFPLIFINSINFHILTISVCHFYLFPSISFCFNNAINFQYFLSLPIYPLLEFHYFSLCNLIFHFCLVKPRGWYLV